MNSWQSFMDAQLVMPKDEVALCIFIPNACLGALVLLAARFQLQQALHFAVNTCMRKMSLPSASLAMVLSHRAPFTSHSTWPHCGACPAFMSSKTTSGVWA